MFDSAATVAFGAATPVLVWFDEDQKLSLTFIEFKPTDGELF
jgi:hypothetical protein